MISSISILGSTGSIGTQTLDVVRNLNLSVSALTANNNIELLEKQIREFKPKLAAVYNEDLARKLKLNISDIDTKVVSGMEGLIEAATIKNADLILNSVVGMVGLKPTIEAANAHKNIALANKETLVTGGKIVMDAVKNNNVSLLPVDSEHSAIFQCLQGMNEKKELKKLILTASGGPFFGYTKEKLKNVTAKEALKHPNWDMGAKITIDSATMMNKGLEIIEASWLFDMPNDKIDVVVHRESIVHSMIEFTDNSVIAQMGLPDMRIPIQYAVTYPRRVPSPVCELDLTKFATLSFYKPDNRAFECMQICRDALVRGGLAPAAANAANEVANRMFLEGKISFLEIAQLVKSAMLAQKDLNDYTLQDILDCDFNAREYVRALVQ